MTKFYNFKHKNKVYKINDEVMLSLKNICMQKASKKLTDKYLDSFRVEALIDKNVYWLKLSASYKRIHSTFYVSLLKLYHRWESMKLSELIEVEDNNEWKVKQVLNARILHGKCMYLVYWKDFIREHDSWESEENLANAKKKIKTFQERHITEKQKKTIF